MMRMKVHLRSKAAPPGLWSTLPHKWNRVRMGTGRTEAALSMGGIAFS